MQYLQNVYKMFDAKDLSGTKWRERDTRDYSLARKKVELMRGRFVQQRSNDGEESEEPRFVVVKKIRDAILEETFNYRSFVQRLQN